MMLPLTFGQSSRPLSILCLGAHADDIEIGCGGTLLRLLAEHPGSHVRWIVFSANNEREAEARASAAAFLTSAGRADVEIHRFRESFFPYVATEIKDAFERIKAGPRPDVVLCHRADDLHQDHRTIGELVWNTFRDHLVLAYEIAKYEGDLGHPNVFVPLSRAQAEQKIAIVSEKFPSQATRAWFRPETFEAVMRLRGVECNAPEHFAEGLYARKLCL
jgi:LmbE family N-acetylglucosaminyl deacetylase